MAEQLELHQRMVYYGLRRMTSSRSDIGAGFAHWQEKFESRPFDVIEIVTELVAYLGLDVGEKKTLMIALHAASSKLYKELDPVPAVLLSPVALAASNQRVSERAQTGLKSSNKEPQIEALERFMQLSCQYLDRINSTEHAELIDIISDEGITGALAGNNIKLKVWGADGLKNLNLNETLDLAECQEIAHNFYVLISEVSGPVLADSITNKAISDLLSTELAQRFNPRDLL